MEKGCPILRFAYLLKKSDKKDGEHISIKDARCMGTYCEWWVEGVGCAIKDKSK